MISGGGGARGRRGGRWAAAGGARSQASGSGSGAGGEARGGGGGARSAALNPVITRRQVPGIDTHTLGVWRLRGQTAPGLTTAEIASADTQLDRAV